MEIQSVGISFSSSRFSPPCSSDESKYFAVFFLSLLIDETYISPWRTEKLFTFIHLLYLNIRISLTANSSILGYCGLFHINVRETGLFK